MDNPSWARVAGQRLNMGGASAFIDHADAIGSTTMETDPSGTVDWDEVNGPWGQVWQETGTRQSEVFAGMDWQVNDPLIPSATREYSDGLGRWMTPDPGGTKVVNMANPQTWNMYAYVTDNPTTLNDPSGLAACSYTNLSACFEVLNNAHASASEENSSHQSAYPANSKHKQKPSEWPHGGGVGVGGAADAGVVITGAAATGSIAGGVFYKPGKGLSTGATTTGGAVAYAGKKDAGAPKQDRPARNLGASAGAGAFVFVTNATSANQLSGHFQTRTLNVGYGPVQATIQLSTGNGIWELSISPPYGGASIGGSVSSITTETCSTPGGC